MTNESGLRDFFGRCRRIHHPHRWKSLLRLQCKLERSLNKFRSSYNPFFNADKFDYNNHGYNEFTDITNHKDGPVKFVISEFDRINNLNIKIL